MRRSVENAAHVGEGWKSFPKILQGQLTIVKGLFAPRAGQSFRDEQRRRRSQYDRGTRLAQMEDSYDNDFRQHGNQTFTSYSSETPYSIYNALPGMPH